MLAWQLATLQLKTPTPSQASSPAALTNTLGSSPTGVVQPDQASLVLATLPKIQFDNQGQTCRCHRTETLNKLHLHAARPSLLVIGVVPCAGLLPTGSGALVCHGTFFDGRSYAPPSRNSLRRSTLLISCHGVTKGQNRGEQANQDASLDSKRMDVGLLRQRVLHGAG